METDDRDLEIIDLREEVKGLEEVAEKLESQLEEQTQKAYKQSELISRYEKELDEADEVWAKQVEALEKNLRAHYTSDSFWKRIYPDGLTAEDVRKELHDFHVMMGEVLKVYSHVTDGQISKPMTAAEHVIRYHDDHVEKLIKQNTEEGSDLPKEEWEKRIEELEQKLADLTDEKAKTAHKQYEALIKAINRAESAEKKLNLVKAILEHTILRIDELIEPLTSLLNTEGDKNLFRGKLLEALAILQPSMIGTVDYNERPIEL